MQSRKPALRALACQKWKPMRGETRKQDFSAPGNALSTFESLVRFVSNMESVSCNKKPLKGCRN